MNLIQSICSNIYRGLFVRTSEQKRKYLIKKGAKIGKNFRMLSDLGAFGSEPYLIEVGDDVSISTNVSFITHDGGVCVVDKFLYSERIHLKLGRIKVGNNVNIGRNATIMPGVTIGDNCIIGLGSIVTKDVESNSVVCGVPAKKIKTIEEYAESIKDKLYPIAKLSKKEKRKYCESHDIK